MSEFKIKFSCGRVAWNHKPHKRGDEGITPQQEFEIVECQKVLHYQTIEATARQIFKLVCEGRCWRAGIYKTGATQSRDIDFQGSTTIALDFDKFEATPQEMVEYCIEKGVEPNFWYYSFSQGIKENNNFRLVWILDSMISPEEYAKLIIALLNDAVFCKADPACKNIGRVWFGTRKGGEFIKSEPISFSAFDVFPRIVEAATPKGGKGKGKNAKAEDIEQATTDQTFIMPKYSFDWNKHLAGVCDLWDKWRQKKYLKYYQRLLLFSELKALKYEESIKKSILDEIMYYYDADLYADSKCNRAEIQYFLSGKTRMPSNKIVVYNGKEYTIAEWFNSGDYVLRDKAEAERTRIPLEKQTKIADKLITKSLEAEKEVSYIELQTEAGKTERIIKYLSSLDLTQTKIIYSIPTYILIDEFIKRITDAGVSKDAIIFPPKVEYTAEEQLYLDFGFPEYVKVNDTMVERKKVLAKVEDTETKGLFILTHAALTHMRRVEAKKIIIDENIEDCLVKRHSINLSALGALKTFVYTKDEILKHPPRHIVIKGETAEEKIAFLESQIKQVCDDIDYLIETVKTAEPQTIINTIDFKRLITYINGYRMSKDNSVREILANIGQLRNATLVSVGENTFKGTRYLYFEIASPLIANAIYDGIGINLFTGTPKLNQLEAGLPEDLRGRIKVIKIPRADPKGNILQWMIKGASGSKASIAKTMDFAIDELESLGVEWRDINLLTLKEFVDMAISKGFKIPTTEAGEPIYIENCAGIDYMKGKDLIVIGKADIPRNSYMDMLHNGNLSDRMKMTTRVIDDTGVEAYIYGFTEPELWELQAEQIRLPLEQAVGRARTLWYDCNVYVFCDFPVRNVKNPTDYIKGGN